MPAIQWVCTVHGRLEKKIGPPISFGRGGIYNLYFTFYGCSGSPASRRLYLFAWRVLLCVVLPIRVVNEYNSSLNWSILFRYEFKMGHLFVLSWSRIQRVAMSKVVSVRYSVCDLIVFSVVEVFVDYGGVYWFVVHDDGLCVVVSVVECCFLSMCVACCVVM